MDESLGIDIDKLKRRATEISENLINVGWSTNEVISGSKNLTDFTKKLFSTRRGGLYEK